MYQAILMYTYIYKSPKINYISTVPFNIMPSSKSSCQVRQFLVLVLAFLLVDLVLVFQVLLLYQLRLVRLFQFVGHSIFVIIFLRPLNFLYNVLCINLIFLINYLPLHRIQDEPLVLSSGLFPSIILINPAHCSYAFGPNFATFNNCFTIL